MNARIKWLLVGCNASAVVINCVFLGIHLGRGRYDHSLVSFVCVWLSGWILVALLMVPSSKKETK